MMSLQPFEENMLKDLSIFSQCLEHYFFKTKDEKFAAISRQEQKFLPRGITPFAECEVSQCGVLIKPTMFCSLVDNCGHIDALPTVSLRYLPKSSNKCSSVQR